MEKSTREALGKTVRERRIAAELSQEALARAAGVATITISRVENGQRPPLDLTLQRIARALGVTVAQLRDGEAA